MPAAPIVSAQQVSQPAPPPKLAPVNDVVGPAAPAAPPVVKVKREADETPADSPLGDWRTEGNRGTVRIAVCGKALCGYLLDQESHAAGESVLINMKPKSADVWSGNVNSRASGATLGGHHDEGRKFAPGRSLRARPLLLLEPDRPNASGVNHVEPGRAGAAVVATSICAGDSVE